MSRYYLVTNRINLHQSYINYLDSVHIVFVRDIGNIF